VSRVPHPRAPLCARRLVRCGGSSTGAPCSDPRPRDVRGECRRGLRGGRVQRGAQLRTPHESWRVVAARRCAWRRRGGAPSSVYLGHLGGKRCSNIMRLWSPGENARSGPTPSSCRDPSDS
jgi:hypothetical protein